MDQILADIRFALRTFTRRPLMTVVAGASLALGIGASSAMFSVVDSVLLRPLPFDEPDRLVSVYPTLPELRSHPTLGDLADHGTFSWPEFWEVHDQAKSFDGVAVFTSGTATIAGEGTPQQLRLARVTPGFFRVLRVRPLHGTPLPEVTDGTDPGRVLVLSHALWQSRFGAQPNAVGTSVTLNDEPYTILGVMPPHAGVGTMQPDVWVLRLRNPRDAEARGNHNITGVIGRLRDGVTLSQATEEAARILRANSPPDHGSVHGGAVYPLHADRTRNVRPALLVLLAASGLLLAVGCANVAAILLGAGLERRQEIAVRGALGATRGRLARQLFTESMALAVIGGVGGVAVAGLATRALTLLAPGGVERIGEASLDARVLGFALVVSIASGVLFGLLPALSLARSSPGRALASSRGTVGAHGVGQSIVVIGELALATVLLFGGALLVRTLVALNRVDPGFEVDQLIAVRLAPPFQRFRNIGADSADRVLDTYFQRFVDEVSSVPGVRAVAVTSNLPLTGDRGNNDVEPEGWQPTGDERLLAERRFVSANYFSTLGIRMVEGRSFSADDERPGALPAMIISEGLARRVWPTGPVVGKRMGFWGRPPATIVGVAADVRDESLDRPTTLAFYVPYRQFGAQIGSLIVRTSGRDPAAVIPAMRARVAAVDPAVAIPTTDPYRVLIAGEVSEQRYRARLMLVFAALAALFAGMGVYGVTARSVARRTREIGIRVALGAEPRRVLAGVLGHGLKLAALGAALGLAAALVGGRVVERLLYGVTARDPVSLVAIAVVVCVLAVLATVPPARRATGVSAMEALRSD